MHQETCRFFLSITKWGQDIAVARVPMGMPHSRLWINIRDSREARGNECDITITPSSSTDRLSLRAQTFDCITTKTLASKPGINVTDAAFPFIHLDTNHIRAITTQLHHRREKKASSSALSLSENWLWQLCTTTSNYICPWHHDVPLCRIDSDCARIAFRRQFEWQQEV